MCGSVESPGYATNVNSHAKNTAFGMKMQSGSSLITLFCLVLRAGVERGTGAGIDRAWKGERAGEDVGGEGRGEWGQQPGVQET